MVTKAPSPPDTESIAGCESWQSCRLCGCDECDGYACTEPDVPADAADIAALLTEHGAALRAVGDYLRGRIGLGTLLSMPGVLAVLEPMVVAGERLE